MTKLSRADLVHLCEIYKAKAVEEHDRFRKWQARALEAEGRLAIYEPADLPPRRTPAPLTDAAGNPSPVLETTYPESE